ncbi:hypothetical protein EU538_05645 [Candidatus Thorarchaeota archaeon]|nr:MAG: hypothetical protein EU538_05645 [Candidatus Thorarchaeota archaeon]
MTVAEHVVTIHEVISSVKRRLKQAKDTYFDYPDLSLEQRRIRASEEAIKDLERIKERARTDNYRASFSR